MTVCSGVSTNAPVLLGRCLATIVDAQQQQHQQHQQDQLACTESCAGGSKFVFEELRRKSMPPTGKSAEDSDDSPVRRKSSFRRRVSWGGESRVSYPQAFSPLSPTSPENGSPGWSPVSPENGSHVAPETTLRNRRQSKHFTIDSVEDDEPMEEKPAEEVKKSGESDGESDDDEEEVAPQSDSTNPTEGKARISRIKSIIPLVCAFQLGEPGTVPSPQSSPLWRRRLARRFETTEVDRSSSPLLTRTDTASLSPVMTRTDTASLSPVMTRMATI